MKRLLFLLSLVCVGRLNAQTWINISSPFQTLSAVVEYDSIYYWKLDTASLTWKINAKSINFTYNSNHDELSNIDMHWNGSVWSNYNQFVYIYDPFNNETSKLTQNWNGSNWVDFLKDSLTYNTNHYVDTKTRESWNGSSWISTLRDTFSYDNNNNMIEDLTPNAGVWDYTYNANNILIQASSQIWNSQQQNWTYGATISYTINGSNLPTLASINSCCGPSQQYIYTYDANNNLINELYQQMAGGTWVNWRSGQNTYDTSNIKKTSVAKYYVNSGTTISGGDSTVYYYNHITNIHSIPTTNRAFVYPNPSNGQFTVAANSEDKLIVDLYDINGKYLFSKNFVGSANIDANDLDNGVYTLTIKGSFGTTNKKIIIVR